MARHSVDLPDPDGPMTTTTSPRSIVQVDVLQHVQVAEPLVDAGQADERLSVRAAGHPGDTKGDRSRIPNRGITKR